ncbi:MAG TPA: NAD(P)-binding domain-containing protein, partial [Myxococcota bacterium]
MPFADLVAPAGPEPSYPKLPRVDDGGRASVPGVYVIGDAAGTPLLKLGMNEGARVAEGVARELAGDDAVDTDVLVVGAGASGLACALRLKKRTKSVIVVDGGALAQTVVSMTRGKHIFAEPISIKNESDLWLEECTREELLEHWRRAVVDAKLDVREQTRLVDIKREGRVLVATLANGTVRARAVVIAVGKSGSPRKANVAGEGEHAGKIRYGLDDASAISGKDILVYGGGDVACECALALAPNNRVTLATIDTALTFPKKRNKDAIEALASSGKLTLALGSKLTRVDAASATVGDVERKNDLVYVMIGADPPVAFFQKLGLALAGDWTLKRYLVAALVFLCVYSLYALKKYPDTPFAWPFTLFVDEASFNAAVRAVFDVAFLPFQYVFTDAAYADIERTTWFQQGYLYSLTYTLLMVVFGWRAMMRWTQTAKRPSYQKWRYLTLLTFQVVFFLLANVVAVQGLSIQNSWRAWGLYQPWPLFFNTFHWWSASDPIAVELLFIGG